LFSRIKAKFSGGPSPRELILVAAVCGYLFFFGLGSFGLVGADEPRYAQVAREMLERNDYVTPTLYGEPWLEKPALYYWRAMIAFEEFGVKDWAARLPSATFGLGMVAIIFFHMRRFRYGAQLDAALITASCIAVIAFARGASTDMQLAGPFTVAMLGWYAWYETGSKFWLIDLYIFLAIGTLAKGPVAPVLAALVIVLFCYLRGDMKAVWKTAFWWPGILIFLAIALPWYILVQLENPHFFRTFILEHNLARFSTDKYRHHQPLWYYLPVFLLALIPWTFFAIPALIDALRSCWNDWRASHLERKGRATELERKNPDAFPEFLVIWTLLPIVFFSISRSKLPGYILPAIPPCTILTADYLQRKRQEAASPLIIGAHAILSGVFVAVMLIFPTFFLENTRLAFNARLITLGISVAVTAMIFLVVRRLGIRYLRYATLVPVVLLIAFIVKLAAPTIDDHYSARPIAVDLQQLGTAGRTVGALNVKRDILYGLAFYRNQKIFNYDEEPVPVTEHLLVARLGSAPELKKYLPGRKIRYLGRSPAQKLEYYWVSSRSDLAK
jgi:4-amino-4-deoxy-L-arabinose transferase-like glycosyltransferase